MLFFQRSFFWLLLLCYGQALCQKATAYRIDSDTLYNGIRLPLTWPPVYDRDQIPRRPPYLDSIPAVIPVNTGRQLFVDEFLVESTDLERVFHQAEKYAGNPVFSATTAYELSEDEKGAQEAVTYLGHGGLFYDPAIQSFRMYYTAGWRGGLALATSKDLIRWERPDLGIVDHSNLLLPAGKNWAGGDNAVWLDLNDRDSMQRLKFLTNRGAMKPYAGRHTLHTSNGGKLWSQGQLVTSAAGDYSSFFYNPFRRIWAYSIKSSDKGPRSRDYAESPEFLEGIDWQNRAVPWVGADSLDLPDPLIGDAAQLYSLNAVAYESILLGEFYIHLGPSNKIARDGKFPKLTEIKLGFSRDGFYWDRRYRGAFIAPTKREGNWDRGYLHGTTGVCLVMGDSLWFPYCGFSGMSPNGTRGMYVGAGIGMATLRRDGFASMDAGRRTGTLTTRKIIFNGRYLFVNVDCPKGQLKVEVLDAAGKPIPGFSLQTCHPIQADKTLHQVVWKQGADLSVIKGQPVRLRFSLSNGSLYAFWISPDESGASYGYVGSGGPGFDGVLDTKGSAAYHD